MLALDRRFAVGYESIAAAEAVEADSRKAHHSHSVIGNRKTSSSRPSAHRTLDSEEGPASFGPRNMKHSDTARKGRVQASDNEENMPAEPSRSKACPTLQGFRQPSRLLNKLDSTCRQITIHDCLLTKNLT